VLLQDDHSTFSQALVDFISTQAAEQSDGDPVLAAMSDERKWQKTHVCNIPHQEDGVNCGVFALVFADCLSAGFPLEACLMTNDNLTAARAHLANALLQVSTPMLHVLRGACKAGGALHNTAVSNHSPLLRC
jgi:hypothetical protein